VRLLLLAIPIIIAAAGCGSEPVSNPVKDVFTATPQSAGLGTPVAFRFHGRRARSPQLYRLPDLDEIPWQFESPESPVRSVIGYAGDRDQVYVLTESDVLAALDLGTGRMRTVDSNVAMAAVGPTGTPFAIHQDGSVASVGLRSLVPWSSGFPELPTRVWAGVRDRLLAVVESDSARALVLVANGQPTVSQPLPAGPVAVSPWGEAALVVTDSGIVLLEPTDPDARELVEVDPAPLLADFSASGHRIVVVRTDGVLLAVDRFSFDVTEELALPGTPTAWRADPWGRWQLLRSADESTIWIVDVVTWTLADSVSGDWNPQLPAIAPDGTILVRRDEQVVSVAVGTEDGPSVDAATSDRWIAMSWDPSRPALEASEPGEPEAALPGQLIYVQVSSTSNPDWAADLAANLRRAGMRATVLPPELPTEPFRVVLGPYPTREEAEATGRQLKLPFWIFTRDTASSRP
jgi:hypothetical protein